MLYVIMCNTYNTDISVRVEKKKKKKNRRKKIFRREYVKMVSEVTL